MVGNFGFEDEKPQLDQLNNIINSYYEKMRLPWADYIDVVKCVQNLEREVQKTLPGARLNIGGSLCNGFAARDSDLDLIFRLESDEPPQNCDEWEMLQKLSKTLSDLGFQTKIIKARVNIVKCSSSKHINRSIDICYYNTLALYNVRLMAKYCDWDSRLPVLGLWVKKWTKECDIGDASSGTLSSYAWMIILIHYLQNCSPPVLPRLQEDFRNPTTPGEIIECRTASAGGEILSRCNVSFHKKVEFNWSQNSHSVAELFVGFLDYLLKFDFSREVIQIRRKVPVTKNEKSWRNTLCIEDPFLLSHNLASRRSNTVIATIWEIIRLTKEEILRTQKFDEETIFQNCKFQGDSRELLRCNVCGRIDSCENNCQNRLERRLKWQLDDTRQQQRVQAPPSIPNPFQPVFVPGLAYPMMIPSWIPLSQFVPPPMIPRVKIDFPNHPQLGNPLIGNTLINPMNSHPRSPSQQQLIGVQQQMRNMSLGGRRNPQPPKFTNENFPNL